MQLTVDCNVNNISASSCAGEHACSSDTSSVVRVDVDGKVGMGFPDSANQTV